MSEREIFIEARKQSDATSRAAFLEAACAGDVVVRQRVERLLRAEGEHDGLVDSPAVALLTDVEQTTTNALD